MHHAVSVLSSMSVCVCVHFMYACACARVSKCVCAFTRLGTGRLLTHFELFSFFIHSPWAAKGSCCLSLPLSLFIFPSSSRSPPSIYLVIIVTWIISDREELSFDNKTPCSKSQRRRETLFWFPWCEPLINSQELPASRCLYFEWFCLKHQHLRWEGRMRCCIQGKDFILSG